MRLFEATMASEATKMAVRGNMHNDTRVTRNLFYKGQSDFQLVLSLEL